MKTFKLKITGTKEDFNVEYNYSTDFGFNYLPCDYAGNEQEKFEAFYKDFKTNGVSSPLNIKIKMQNQSIDRGILRNEVLKFTEVNSFIERLIK